jgi:hypothetical protein
MKELLRSCFVADPTDSSELLSSNYHALLESSLGFDVDEDEVIWKYIQDFFKAHGHVPTIQTMRTHYANVQEVDVVDRLERLAMIKPRTRGDFLSYLEVKATDLRNKEALQLAKDMATITATGLEIKDAKGKSTTLRGAVDAIRYVLDKSHALVAPTFGGKLSGNVMHDGEDFLDRYERIKSDPLHGIGHHCGIEQIDAMLNGAKRHELWIHAGFTGSLKSTFALHWAYLQAVYLGFSSVYFSLEMPYTQVRNILYTMHSAHEDFVAIRRQLGIEGLGLDYEKVRDAKLNPNEEKFLFDYVVPSMNKERVVAPTVYPDGSTSRAAGDYGDVHIEVADPNKTDFTVLDMRAKAELIYTKTPFALIFVDHAGLMSARERHTGTTEKLNEVVRDLKKLAMSFNRGMGIAVVALFQISREGFKTAEKAGGRYNLTALAYANEAERSADIVTTTWIDDYLRKQSRAIFQCLKSRDQKPFDRTPVKIEFPCRRILTDNTTAIEELDSAMQSDRSSASGDGDGGNSKWQKKKKLLQQPVDLDLGNA